jgi:hypothetical protein
MPTSAIDGSRVREHREPLAAQSATEVSNLGAVKLIKAGEHYERYIPIQPGRIKCGPAGGSQAHDHRGLAPICVEVIAG